jgi:hypothetical protein
MVGGTAARSSDADFETGIDDAARIPALAHGPTARRARSI